MNEATIQVIIAELLPQIKGKRLGKIFQLSRLSLAVDLGIRDGLYLFLGFENNPAPRIYLIKRRVKDLEKASRHPSPFLLLLRKRLGTAILTDVVKMSRERIVRFEIQTQDELGNDERYCLLAQFTGRSADLFLLGAGDRIIDSLRETDRTGETYQAPSGDNETHKNSGNVFSRNHFPTLSEALDSYYQKLAAEKVFAAKAKTATDEIKREIKKREKLRGNLMKDLESHGDIEQQKRWGDLLLANPSAKIKDGKVKLIDFFADNTPEIEIDIQENLTIPQAAQKHFAAYTKARRAVAAIPKRILAVTEEIRFLQQRMEKAQSFIDTKDTAAFEHFVRKEDGVKEEKVKEKLKEPVAGARRFVSSDGFEILVGRGAKDNDHLTFRIGKAQDLWLHAADYPGSHVIVRNPNRKEIPNKTTLEAAQLAAFYSQAKKEAKAAVNYTQQKNVSKIKGGAPGLVRISTFKTIMVEPKKLPDTVG
ncbi:MAG TPA: NFACT RNA binding domain-containing protein [Pyrinomonadaceae bacterium]|nr:NFACT RNA binding domain-containing protein [Pyrinomonadaceae bacterium]